nr:hypothetical protein [Saprospiraceae bacterium]
ATLASHLLLNSDLRGNVLDLPDYFPHGDEPKLKMLDLVMMTHGWRRFDWQDAIQSRYPSLRFLPENGFSFYGQVEPNKKVNKRKKADVALSLLGKNFTVLSATSDSLGQFVFRDLELTDSSGLVFRAQKHAPPSSKKNKRKENPLAQETLDLELRTYMAKPHLQDIRASSGSTMDRQIQTDYAEIIRYNRTVDERYANVWSIDLDEVVVSEEKLDPHVAFHESSILYEEPDDRVLISEFPTALSYTNMFDFIRGKVTGVDVIGTYPSRTIRIRGTNTILGDPNARFLLDGSPVTAEFLNNYPMERIAFIDVIKSMSRSVALGGNQSGIVAVYSKSPQGGEGKEVRTDLISISHPGYHSASEYYVPAQSELTAAYLDHRTSLLWAPELNWKNGQAEAFFYTSNQQTDYLIIIEGMSAQGKVFQGISSFKVR